MIKWMLKTTKPPKKLCDTCTRHVGFGKCSIPYKLDEGYSTWESCKDVLKDDECVYFNYETNFVKIKNKIRQKWYFVKNIYLDTTSFIKHNIIGRIRHGFDTRDVWDLGQATAKFMKPRLKLYIDNQISGKYHSVPACLTDIKYISDNNLVSYFDTIVNFNNIEHEDSNKLWINILHKISFAIEYMVDSTKIE